METEVIVWLLSIGFGVSLSSCLIAQGITPMKASYWGALISFFLLFYLCAYIINNIIFNH